MTISPRLHIAVSLFVLLALYGWIGQRDYEDARALECAQRMPPKVYDAATDRCTHSTAMADNQEK